MLDNSTIGWCPAKDMRFATSLDAIALAVSEVPFVAQSVPVAFMRSNADWRAMAIFSPADGRNRFVTEEGHWRGHYVPSLLRAYPFMLRGESEKRQLMLWPTVKAVPLDEGVEPFLIDGHPTERVQRTLSFLSVVHADIAKADAAIQILDAAGVLVPWSLPGDGQSLSIGGTEVRVVDPDKLAALPEHLYLGLRKIDALPWIYAHVHSLHFAQRFGQEGDLSWSVLPAKSPESYFSGLQRQGGASDVLAAIAGDLGDFEL